MSLEKAKFRSLVSPTVLDLKPYKPGKPIEELKREKGLTRVIKMASNENPLGPSPKAAERLRECAGGMNIYPDGYGYELKKALSEKFGVKPEEIALGNGSSEIIEMTVRLFCGPGKKTVVASPSFSIYHITVMAQGGEVVEVPLKDHAVDLGAILDAVDADTSLVILGNPNNPTGTVFGGEEWKRFFERLPLKVAVLLDEAYAEFAEGEDFPGGVDYINRGKPLIVARTFSKAYGLAGLRIGYGFADAEIIDYMNRLRLPFNANLAAQEAARAALGDEEFLEKSLSVNSAGRKALYAFFEAEGIEYIKSEANFMMAKVGDGDGFFAAMLDEGVIIRSASGFGAPEWIRVSIGLPEEIELFKKAFLRVNARLGKV
jgi:histidinol-phosphate aminotransferase